MPFRSARLRIVGSSWEPLLWVAPAGLALLVVFVYPLVSSFRDEPGELEPHFQHPALGRSLQLYRNHVEIRPGLPKILRVTATYTGLPVVS